jgi:3-methyladenine DNA glycosylase AlkD
MDLAGAMRALRAKGKTNTAKIYRRHGVRDDCFGVSYADVGALVRKIKVDHELAKDLWRTGVHDARVLATKIVDPRRLSRRDLEHWLGDVNNYILGDALSAAAARHPDAAGLARAWIQADGEWLSSSGWNVYAILATDRALDEREAARLVDLIPRRIHSAPNRTRHAMNGALIAIGGMPAVRKAALAAARVVGPVEVDHGETGCKTPDAVAYITGIADRPARTRVTGARMKPPARRGKAQGRRGRAART